MFANAKLQTILLTSNLSRAQPFFQDVLGLTLKGTSDNALVFDVGGSDLRVSLVPATTPSEHTVAGFEVENVDEAVARLSTAGITMEHFPGFQHRANGTLVTPGGATVAWMRDPDGNLLSIVTFG